MPVQRNLKIPVEELRPGMWIIPDDDEHHRVIESIASASPIKNDSGKTVFTMVRIRFGFYRSKRFYDYPKGHMVEALREIRL